VSIAARDYRNTLGPFFGACYPLAHYGFSHFGSVCSTSSSPWSPLFHQPPQPQTYHQWLMHKIIHLHDSAPGSVQEIPNFPVETPWWKLW